MFQLFNSGTFVSAGIVTLSFVCSAYYICYNRFKKKCTCQKQYTEDEVVLIIGSAPGIALETAMEVVRRGARVVLANKIRREAEEMRDKIQRKLGVERKTISIMELDFARFSSVIIFLMMLMKELRSGELVAIVNTEQLRDAPLEITDDGFDKTFQTNYVGPFLLVESLDGLLNQKLFPRIINLSAGQSSSCELEDVKQVTLAPHNIQSYRNNAYQLSKVCIALISLVYWTDASCVDPGNVNHTNFDLLAYNPWSTPKESLSGVEGVLHALFKPPEESCYEDMNEMYSKISPMCIGVIEHAKAATEGKENNENILLEVIEDLYNMLMDQIINTANYVELMLETLYLDSPSEQCLSPL